jgi:hypothetical protein
MGGAQMPSIAGGSARLPALMATVGRGLLSIVPTAPAQQLEATAKLDIRVAMADDIGYWNICACNRGMIGDHTLNIGNIANAGAICTDYS